jgi:acid phosphatase
MSRKYWAASALAVVVAAGVVLAATAAAGGSDSGKRDSQGLGNVKHLVVIYEENHSFDNLYGGWEGVNGRQNATPVKTLQTDQNGLTYGCLLQLDVNLTTPPLGTVCKGVQPSNGSTFSSAFPNAPFTIDDYIAPTDTTCPAPGVFAANGVAKGAGLPGGCTRDIVHRFYQEQYQIDGGKQDRYATGSDAAGLVMGQYDTQALPIYKYLHSHGAPSYVIMDNFFQSAFGGSFLNHQFMIAAAAPVDNNAADAGLHSILDTAGFPNAGYPLYKPLAGQTYKDAQLTQACGLATTIASLACGNYGVNTMQPSWQPKGGGAVLPPQTGTNIGDELNAKHIDWAWYAGGWSNADGDVGAPGWTNGNGPSCSDPSSTANPAYPYCPDKNFQFHHQPFNYFAEFDPSTTAGKANRQAHLKDEAEFISAAAGSHGKCDLKDVSFVKPVGSENEHPGYASESVGSDHLVELLQTIENGACAKDTMVLVTYDEFGGQYDHVSPPSASNPIGPSDLFGPGTRIPALVLAPGLHGGEAVDSSEHDTTSFIATVERQYGLAPLGTRDAQVNDLSTVYSATPVKSHGDDDQGDDDH